LDQSSAGADVHVPAIWPLEVTNALVKAFRRRFISREELFEYAQQLSEVHVLVDGGASQRAFSQILALAERYQLTTYDASYLELAQRLGISIATTDRGMVQAAGAIKVPVLAV
jgi:predicted nucleic acid-binding protein